jgi:hypothetical protein
MKKILRFVGVVIGALVALVLVFYTNRNADELWS